MDRMLRRLTPVVLVGLAVCVWFENQLVGDRGLLRFVVGVLCLYILFLVLERQRMELRFTQVLESFKKFYEERGGARDTAVDPQKTVEAATILIAALYSDEADVRETAQSNLKRLTGKDFGSDPQAWQRWLDGAKAELEAAAADAKE